MLSRNEQGYMGISTLVVFIAAILVAAVVASVLIFSVQLLKQQAEKTLSDTIFEVSSGVNIVTMMGDRNVNGSNDATPSDYVQVLELTIKLRPGSPEIDMDEMTVYIMHGEKAAYLSLDASGSSAANASATTYVVRVERDPDNSFADNHVIGDGDIITILINVGSSGTNHTVVSQSKITIKFIPRIGGTLQEELIVLPYKARYVDLI